MERLTAGMDAYDPEPAGSVDRDRAILNYIMKSLRATRPWTRLLSVLGFICTALTVLAGIAIIVGQDFIPLPKNAPPMEFMGIFYILAGAFYLIPSIWLSKYSTAISSFLGGGDALELGKAIAYQKSFWKFVGILALVSIAVAVVGIVVAILVPLLLSFRG